MPRPDRTKDNDGRALPKGFKVCSKTHCGSVDGSPNKKCSPTGGTCKDHGCECWLFRHEMDDKDAKNKKAEVKNNPWEAWAGPDFTRTGDDQDYDYACLCVEVNKAEAKEKKTLPPPEYCPPEYRD